MTLETIERVGGEKISDGYIFNTKTNKNGEANASKREMKTTVWSREYAFFFKPNSVCDCVSGCAGG